MAQPKKKFRQSHRPEKKPAPAFSGNHQRSWLWGHHAVIETLQSGLWPVLEVYATLDAFNEAAELLTAKQKKGIPVEVVTSERLFELAKSTEHQGLVARLGPYPYRSLESFEDELRALVATHQKVASSGEGSLAEPAHAATTESPEPSKPPLIVICDRIQDTFNFGAILRCCDGAGVLGVIVGERSQAEVTPHVARSSVGAVNYVPVIQTESLVAAAKVIKSLGFQLVGADGNTQQSAWTSSLSSLTALVIGSEATGIAPELLDECDQRLCIPMQGHVTSLNAAVAAGILLYEIRRQQNALGV